MSNSCSSGGSASSGPRAKPAPKNKKRGGKAPVKKKAASPPKPSSGGGILSKLMSKIRGSPAPAPAAMPKRTSSPGSVSDDADYSPPGDDAAAVAVGAQFQCAARLSKIREARAELVERFRAALEREAPPSYEAVVPTKAGKATSEGVVQIRAIPQRSAVDGKGRSQLKALFEVKTGSQADTGPRPYVDLAVVVDTSGSMAGKPMEKAKLAICKVIKHLREGDRLHLIQFASSARIIFTNADLRDKTTLERKVNQLKATGGTNVPCGLELGFKCLAESACDSGDKNFVRRIFIFSDGESNEGMKSVGDICQLTKDYLQCRVSTSSFGIGESFNEALMRGLAESGQGDFAFIQGAHHIGKEVSKAIHGLLAVVGTDARLQLEGQNGCTVDRAFGHEDESNVSLGDLLEDNTVGVLTSLTIAPPREGARSLIVARYKLTYNVPGVEGSVMSFEGVLEVDLAESASAANALPEANEVAVARILAETSEVNEAVLALMEDNSAPKAIERQEELLAHLRANLHLDSDGFITRMIADGEKTLRSLQAAATQGEAGELSKRAVRSRAMKSKAINKRAMTSGEDSDVDECASCSASL